MSSSTKSDTFSFNTEFGEDGRVLNEGTSTSYKHYNQQDLDEACAAARDEALKSVEADMQRQVAASVQQIVSHIAPTLPFSMQLAETLRQQSIELALQMARKIAGAALTQYPAEAIEACLKDIVSDLPRQANISLKVAPDLIEVLAPVLATLQPPGQSPIQLIPDAQASPGSWQLEWEAGAVTGNPEHLADRIEQAIQAYLTQPLEPQGDLFASVA